MTNTPQWKKKPDIVNALMADILKYELSRAVSVSVDSIFKSMPLLEPPAVGMEMTHAPHRSPLLDYHQEALADQIQRPSVSTRPPRQHHPKPDFYSFSHRTDLPSEDQASGCLKGGGGMDQAVGFKKKTSKEAAGGAFMLSRPFDALRWTPVFLEGLCVPLDVDVKSDGSQGVLMSNFFSLAGGLTTSHLKKAKLMFFYTRYPSSLVLKTFFHDVQFTRCITSQLIKWFSNFREFYYIQMEKQARQASAQGPPHASALSVGRESELFRALNMHYNKASDFQVPERFLEVAAITLREFYAAVSLGKDSDPSWKKPIYKVICKLDSSVPEEFKTHYPD
ncbi:hypothetical protein CRUP_001224 [Coryphaenoides rupestris]|nr:hypothetical protein CRUP_001224 [Coryphaenoides rupestris]